MVDIETNPLYYATVGGIILGIATSLHYVLKGKVTGMSGIIYDVTFFNKTQMSNKLIIIGGILISSGVFFDIFGYGTYNNFTPFGPKDQISKHTSLIGYAIAGLFVGFGTKLGNGCTSGHGLCGLPRLSIRSFVAVGIFLTTAISIATIKYYATLGALSQGLSPHIQYNHMVSANICIGLGVIFFWVGFIIDKIYNCPSLNTSIILRDNIISLTVGIIFGLGLLMAGMVRRINILQFLWMGKDWNPSLLFVLGSGVIFNLIVFNYMIKIKKAPVFAQKLFNPDNNVIDWKLVIGAMCFGFGWGIGGLCPGPALALLPAFQVQIHVIWFAALIFGMFLAAKLAQLTEKKKNQQQQQNQIEPNQAFSRIQNNEASSQILRNKKQQQLIYRSKKQICQAPVHNLDVLDKNSQDLNEKNINKIDNSIVQNRQVSDTEQSTTRIQPK